MIYIFVNICFLTVVKTGKIICLSWKLTLNCLVSIKSYFSYKKGSKSERKFKFETKICNYKGSLKKKFFS